MRSKSDKPVSRAFKARDKSVDFRVLSASDKNGRAIPIDSPVDSSLDLSESSNNADSEIEDGSDPDEEGQGSENIIDRPSPRSALVRELAPKFHHDVLRSMLLGLEREPFVDLLTMFMGCHPDPDKVLEFANRNPYQWAQAVNLLGKMSGFSEKVEVDNRTSVIHLIKQASDSELELRLLEIRKALQGPIIEQTPVAARDTELSEGE